MTEAAAAEPAGCGERPAGKSAASWLVLVSVLIFGLSSDLISKHLAFERVAGGPVVVERADVLAVMAEEGGRLGVLIPPHEPVVVVPELLEFTLVLNPGAVFGVGAGKRWLFVLFTIGALTFATLMFAVWTQARDRVAHAAIGLLLAGGLGNLYDRLVFACVRDFIHPLPGVDLPFGLAWPGGARAVWPYVSNVADLWLIVGIGVLLIYSLRRPAVGEGGVDDA